MTVISKRRQRACRPRSWVPKLTTKRVPRLLDGSKATGCDDARPGEPSAAVSIASPAGIVERGMYARAVQEPGMESRRSCRMDRNGTARKIEPAGRREVGARSRSYDVGEPAPGDPAEQRSAPENRLAGGRR